jgi:cytidylate kinase
LKEHYEKDIDDPLLYDLVLNTDRMPYEEAARLIGDAVIHEFHLGKQTVAAAA